MAVRLEVAPTTTDDVQATEDVPLVRANVRRFGFVRLARRSDDGRSLFGHGNGRRLMLLEDHFALRHLCRA